MKATNLNLEVRPSDYKGFIMDSFIKDNPCFSADNLEQMGVTISQRCINDAAYMAFVKKCVEDAGLVNGEAQITTPLQFAQLWMPEVIDALYRARTASKIFGSKNVGTWELEQIVWTKLALTGRPNVYDDFSKANLSSYNLGFVTRDTVRFEMGIEVTELEQKRAGQMRQNAHGLKKNAVDLGFDVLTNHVKWFGYTGEGKAVYGLLNAPAGDVTVQSVERTFASSTTAQLITFLQGVINNAMTRLGGNYDPESDAAVLVLPLGAYTYLTTANDYNLTARKWLTENFPKVEVKVAPELDGAAADGDNLAIFYVPQVQNFKGGTVDLLDTSKLRLVGAVPTTKGFEESYSCSTAGAMIRCPLAYNVYEGV